MSPEQSPCSDTARVADMKHPPGTKDTSTVEKSPSSREGRIHVYLLIERQRDGMEV